MRDRVDVIAENLSNPPYTQRKPRAEEAHRHQVVREQDILHILEGILASNCRLYVNNSVLSKS